MGGGEGDRVGKGWNARGEGVASGDSKNSVEEEEDDDDESQRVLHQDERDSCSSLSCLSGMIFCLALFSVYVHSDGTLQKVAIFLLGIKSCFQ